jgi:hypothetical protein
MDCETVIMLEEVCGDVGLLVRQPDRHFDKNKNCIKCIRDDMYG